MATTSTPKAPPSPAEARSTMLKLLGQSLKDETDAIASYTDAISTATELGDHATAALLTEIMHDEENHMRALAAHLSTTPRKLDFSSIPGHQVVPAQVGEETSNTENA